MLQEFSKGHNFIFTVIADDADISPLLREEPQRSYKIWLPPAGSLSNLPEII